jgi:predicted DNA binding CopG/RHH family protein
MTENRGGYRVNSGQKPKGRVPYNVRLTPIMILAIKDRARDMGIAANELIHRILDEWFAGHP